MKIPVSIPDLSGNEEKYVSDAIRSTWISSSGSYVKRYGDREAFTRANLTSLASEGRFVGTFTARMGAKANVNDPQPALWTLGPIEKQSGHQKFPTLRAGDPTMTISGRHILEGAHVIVDGTR